MAVQALPPGEFAALTNRATHDRVNNHADPAGAGATHLRTETRVVAANAAARARFG